MQWLRVGAVGVGLAAAVVTGGGVASASSDDSSDAGASSSSSGDSSDAGTSSSGSDGTSIPGKTRSSSYGGSSSGGASDDTGSATSSGGDSDAGADDGTDGGDDDDDSDSLTSADSELDVDAEVAEDAEDAEDDEDADIDADSELSSGGDPQDADSDEEPQLETDDPDEAPAQSPESEVEEGPDVEAPVESAPTVPEADPAASTETPTAAPESDPESPSQSDTSATVTLSAAAVPESEAVTAASTAAPAAVTAAATAAPGTGEWYFLGTLERAVRRLAGWPGTPRNFVDITNYQTDQSLDAANDQLDNLVFTVPTGNPARWLPDLLNMAGAFFVAAIPGSLFTDSLNAMGDFLNRVVPPFVIEPGADTLNVITPYKIMGAAVVGTATVLEDMLNGEYDPAQWAIHVIKATTGANVTTSDLTDFDSLSGKVVAAQAAALLGGDGGAFDEPERAWDITLPTWTAAQVNPFTVATYVVLVGMYKRFQEMAVLTTFTTSTTYESWHYKNALGMYAAGSFHAVDPDGNSVDFFGVSQGGTYRSDTNALVTINTANGGYTYTPPALWDSEAHDAEFFHRSTSENEADRYDYVNIPVRSADGVKYTLRFGVEIIGGTNANPTGSFSVINTDAAGVVKGKVNGSDSDGDTLTYSLVESSVNDLDGNSAYTKNGSDNGGIVTINETTGDFTYVSSATAGATQSFQVMINDGHYGNTPITVTVPNTTTINPANVDTSTENVVTGTVPGSTNYPGLFTGYALGTAPAKGTVTSFNPATGAFTYTRDGGLGHTTTSDDVVTVLATDANGRTVTLRMAVQPTVDNDAPTLTLTTAPTVGTLSGTTQTSTGKVTYSDPNGDAAIWPSSVTTARGGTVTFAADGSFTYTSNLSTAERHEAARIGAAGSTYNGVALAAYEDAFIATVADGFGGTATVTVKVPIYAINSAPEISGFGGLACAFYTCTVGTMTVSDPDGDNIPRTEITPGSGAGYTLDKGSVTVWGSGTTTISWGAGGFFGTGKTANRFTVYDGYYAVTNGVVNVGTPTKFWANWAEGSGNRTTGN